MSKLFCVATMLAAASLSACEARAADGWRVVRSRTGSAVARLEFAGAPLRALEFACLDGRVALGVHPAAAVAGGGLPVLFTAAGGVSRPIMAPRMGSTPLFAAVLADNAVVDGLAGGWSDPRVAVGQVSLKVPNGAAALREALAACYRPAAARTPAPAAPAGASGEGLPAVVRRDLEDYASTCRRVSPEDDRGHFVMNPAAITRIDLNADGVEDIVLDAAKLHCSKSPPGASGYGLVSVYTSDASGALQPSFDAHVDSVAVVRTPRPGLRLHVDAIPGDEIDDPSPAITETVTMTGPARWSPSKTGEPWWRLQGFERYPEAVRALLDSFERRCAAVNRRASISAVAVVAMDGKQPIDLNGDRVPDYLVDATSVGCSLYDSEASPTGFNPFGRGGDLYAIVSKPGGYAPAWHIPKSVTLQGNGDPGELHTAGGRTIVCFGEFAEGSTGEPPFVRYSWTGTTAVRTVLRQYGCR